MPCIELQITKGATREQEQRIVEEFTDTLFWGFAEMLTTDWKAKQ